MNRREFIAGAAGATALAASGGAGLTGYPTDGGKRFMTVSGAVAPPGARSVSRLKSRCSACGLCISSCPGKTLRAAGVSSYGLGGMMMPRLDFSKGFCSPDCHKCAEVCPAGAIELAPSPEDRARIRVGIAEWHHWECITEKGSACGLCARRCPAKAITMKKREGSEFEHPVVNQDLCIGCGTCEHYCPAQPKAIVVKGLALHETARDASPDTDSLHQQAT